MVAAQNGPQLESKQWEKAFIPFYCEVVVPFKNNLVLSLKIEKVDRFLSVECCIHIVI